jgi:hypothetical protein
MGFEENALRGDLDPFDHLDQYRWMGPGEGRHASVVWKRHSEPARYDGRLNGRAPMRRSPPRTRV